MPWHRDSKRESGEMPEGSAVHKTYVALKRKGYDKGKAAGIAQSVTGQALATGRPPMRVTMKKKRSK